jgi:hypothetical protein
MWQRFLLSVHQHYTAAGWGTYVTNFESLDPNTDSPRLLENNLTSSLPTMGTLTSHSAPAAISLRVK